MIRRGRESGIALVVVLWVGLLIAAIAGAFVLDTRTSARLTRNFIDNAEARAMANGGIHLAVFELLRRDPVGKWKRDGRRYQRTLPGGLLQLAIEDEAGKINLNLAGNELLEGLFLSAGVPPNQTSSLVDAVEETRLRSQQVRSSNSAARGRSSAINGAFTAVDALGQLSGITPEIYARLRPALTVYGRNKGLNYANAPREALQAVEGVPSEAMELFLARRGGEDSRIALNDFLTQGRARQFWNAKESDIVTVKVLAQTQNGARFARIAVVEIGRGRGEAFLVREWRQGDASMFPSEPPTHPTTPQRLTGPYPMNGMAVVMRHQ